MLSTTIDVTAAFNAASKVNLDLSGWDTVTLQIQTPSGSINFNGTDDAGAIQGVSDGNASTAINWQPLAMTNTATNTTVVASGLNGIFKTNLLSRFIQLIGSSITVSKMIVYLSKIN
jgi:hypothetical protein